MSSIEVAREISMSKSLTPTAERSLSRHDISRESAKSAEESLGKRRSGAEPTVEKDVGLDRSRADDSLELKVVPEELSGMYSPQLSGAHDVSSDSSEGLTLRHNFFRRCERARGLQQYTTFREVCPTSMKRHHAAARFAALLELCKEEKLFVKQRHPYSEIYISSRKDGLPQ
ncbi:hypothetical protein BaRGS_00025553 [Batillaria attramentaria]|uniref:Rad21/Rec8-like protein C-terminal eukaryotic domain-containing protein n=1 Tax=Batillaria attramentaria TaxID=370345 RepID=A0ABD0K862_9CAEN